jgi:opacity protein-like surface antigen
MKRVIVAGIAGIALLTATPVFAQTEHHPYVRVFSDVRVQRVGSTDLGVAAGADATSWLRVSGEIGRMADVTPSSVKSQFDDPFLAAVGVTVSPRISALYGLTSATLTLPVHERVRPYVGGGIGIARMTNHLDVTGWNEFGRMIRDDRATGMVPGTTRSLTSIEAGVAVTVTRGVAVNLGYRSFNVLHDREDLVTNRVQIGLTLGF